MYKEDDESDLSENKNAQLSKILNAREDANDLSVYWTSLIEKFIEQDTKSLDFLNYYLFIAEIGVDPIVEMNDLFQILNNLLHIPPDVENSEIMLDHAIQVIFGLSALKDNDIIESFINDEILNIFVSLFSHPNKEIATFALYIIYNLMLSNPNLVDFLEQFNFWQNLFVYINLNGNEDDQELMSHCYKAFSKLYLPLWNQNHSNLASFLQNYYAFALHLFEFRNPLVISRAFQCLSKILSKNQYFKVEQIIIDEIMYQSTVSSCVLDSIFVFLENFRNEENFGFIRMIEENGFNNNLINLIDHENDVYVSHILSYLGINEVFPDCGDMFWEKIINVLQFAQFSVKYSAMHFIHVMFKTISSEMIIEFWNEHFLEIIYELLESDNSDPCYTETLKVLRCLIDPVAKTGQNLAEMPFVNDIYELLFDIEEKDLSNFALAQQIIGQLNPYFNEEN